MIVYSRGRSGCLFTRLMDVLQLAKETLQIIKMNGPFWASTFNDYSFEIAKVHP